VFAIVKAMLAHFIAVYIPNIVPIDTAIKSKIMDVIRDHRSFRSHVGYKDPAVAPVDSTWRAGWPESAEAVLSFVEDCWPCYARHVTPNGASHQEYMKRAVAARRSPTNELRNLSSVSWEAEPKEDLAHASTIECSIPVGKFAGPGVR
jgi:hypothetical protein